MNCGSIVLAQRDNMVRGIPGKDLGVHLKTC